MPNRNLTADELIHARALLDDIRARMAALAGNDRELLFAYRRKIAKELSYDERSKPMQRKALKRRKHREQKGLCPLCDKPLPERYAVLDRLKAVDGYTDANTRLIHQDCDAAHQESKGYA